MPEPSNADKARELLANPRTYRAEAEADTARAQVYALLAIADALTTKDNND